MGVGDWHGGVRVVSSARVTLNGTEVAGPSDFNQNVAVIDRTVSLQATNTLVVRLTSAPGSVLTISVLATSMGPQPTGLTPNPLNLTAGTIDTLTATLAPAPTAAGSLPVNSSDPGVATVPASVPFAVGQTSLPIPVTAVAAGTATITVTLNGASAASQVTVVPPPPTVSGLTPVAGKLSDAVTIIGTNFVNVQAVTFNGVAASAFTGTSATALVATVPIGAATGPLAVTTAGGTAQSATNFTVIAVSGLTVTPSQATLPLGAMQPFRSTATFADQSSREVTTLTTWTSASPSIAPVTAGGVAQGVALGTTTITGALGGLSASGQVQVVAASPTPLPPDPATVAPPIDPTVVTSLADATAFLYTGANPIQTGVAAGTIVAQRAAVGRKKEGSGLAMQHLPW